MPTGRSDVLVEVKATQSRIDGSLASAISNLMTAYYPLGGLIGKVL